MSEFLCGCEDAWLALGQTVPGPVEDGTLSLQLADSPGQEAILVADVDGAGRLIVRPAAFAAYVTTASIFQHAQRRNLRPEQQDGHVFIPCATVHDAVRLLAELLELHTTPPIAATAALLLEPSQRSASKKVLSFIVYWPEPDPYRLAGETNFHHLANSVFGPNGAVAYLDGGCRDSHRGIGPRPQWLTLRTKEFGTVVFGTDDELLHFAVKADPSSAVGGHFRGCWRVDMLVSGLRPVGWA